MLPNYTSDEIAIIGMAGRFPGARDIEEFWQNLRDGVESIRPFTVEELKASGVDPAIINHPSYVNAGAPFEESDSFDAAFFGYYPKEAELMDPQHRVLLETAWTALEHAGYAPYTYDGLIGVFAGVARNAYLLTNLATHSDFLQSIGEYNMLIANERDFPANRIAFKLNLTGPAINLQTACSTSGVAIHMACQSILNGDSDIALAGACKVIVPREAGYWYVEGGPLAPDGHIRAFDAQATGMVRGTGGAFVVLKRLEEAIQDGDTIHAVIRSSAINNDGAAKIGFSAPSIRGQAAAIAEAHAIAGITADTITYVETHGTGTIIGDPIEIAGLSKAFRESTDQRGYCAIGSVKTNIGHLDVAASVAGVIKTVQALKHKTLPPSLNYETPNPQIDFENSPFYVNNKLTHWPAGDIPRRAGVSSFGLGGTNSHIILEETPTVEAPSPSRPYQLLLLSAKTETARGTATSNLTQHLQNHPDIDLADAAYTLQIGREHFQHRRMLVCSDAQDALDALKTLDRQRMISQSYNGNNPSVVFMFPGGGTQYANMAMGLYQEEGVFREAVDTCAEILQPCLDLDIRTLIYPANQDTRLAGNRLKSPSLALPALFSIEYALAKLWQSWGLQPAAMIGHSMGEYTAACLAGVFSLDDALALVTRRGKLFEKLPAGAMLSVPLSEAEARVFMADTLDFAAVNKPDLCVVSGPVPAIEAMQQKLAASEIDSTRIHISVAAHSRLVEPILSEFREFLHTIHFSAPSIPYISNVTGNWIADTEAADPDYWVEHLRRTVRFADGLQTLLAEPEQLLIEVGPGQTLSLFARHHPAKTADAIVVSSLRHPRETTPDQAFLLNSLGRLWLGGAEIDWKAYYAQEFRQRIPLPTYPFERKRYWIDPAKPAGRSLNGTLSPDGDIKLKQEKNREQVQGEPLAPPAAARSQMPANLLDTPSEGTIAMTQTKETLSTVKETSRKDRIIAALQNVVHDLSGLDINDIDPYATFLELGFDSLFLTQANSAFKKKFKVKLTVRQLLEKYSRIAALAEYLDEKLSPEAFPPETPPQPKPTALPAPSIAPQAPTTNIPLSLPNGETPADASLVERIINQQLRTMEQLMAQQLAALGGANIDAVASSLPSGAPAAQPVQPQQPPQPQKDGKVSMEKTSPWQPVEAGEDGKLPSKQQAHLDALIAETTARTAKSKAHTQAHRAHLADPRTVQGFKTQWKEMVYPIVAERTSGSKMWDIDGNEYIDLVNGYGVTFLGHSPAFITEAAQRQLNQGMEIGPQNRLAGEVASLVCEMTGMDRAAMCNTGSEAVLAAIRMARAVTGRDRIATFAGHYHGIFNEVLVKGLNIGRNRRTVPIAPGIPQKAVEDTLVMEYGNFEALDLIREHADELALVLVEPVRSRNPNLQPVEFLRALRKLTEELDIPLLFDEIVTGFRSHPGGVQALFGVRADLATYGKVIGGGYPIGIVAGKKEFMDALDGGMWQYGDDSTPEADMTWFAGTFVRHPLAMATAHATLSYLKEQGPQLQEDLNAKTAAFAAELNQHFQATNAPIRVEHFSSFIMVTFKPYQEYADLLFYHLRNRGIYTYGGRPAFFTSAHTDEDFAKIAQAFKESVAELQNVGLFPGGPVRDPNKPFEISLSEGQQEIWLATRFGPDASCAFNLASTLRLKGNLQLDKLNDAALQLVKRHEALRAVPNADGMTQRILPAKEFDIPLIDISEVDKAARQKQVAELKSAEVRTPFDLENGPLYRAKVIKLSHNDHFFIFTAHHIVADGWSCGVLMRDLGKLYAAACEGRAPDMGQVMQLSEYVELGFSEDQAFEREEANEYWFEQFAESVPVLELPIDRPRPPAKTYNAKRIWLNLDKEFTDKLRQMASEQGVTLFTTVLAGFKAFISRITGQSDLGVGFSVAGQANIQGRDLVGHCVRFLPLRTQIDTQAPFTDLLQTMRGKVFDAVEYQNFTFGSLLKKLKLTRDPSRMPIMSVAFNLDPHSQGIGFHDLAVEAGSVPREFENFEIFFNLVELADGIEIQCTFNTDLFDAETMERRLLEYKTMLAGTIANPRQPVANLPLLPDSELQQLLVEWIDTSVDFPAETCIHHLFEAQVDKNPNSVALSFETEILTYQELDQQANQLAHHLLKLGIQPDALVGVRMERSLEMIVALLGILKAGGAYLPIDTQYPPERVGFMLADAQVPVLLTQQKLLPTLPEFDNPVVALDADWDTIACEPVGRPITNVTAQNLAYVIYTSGSTGKPKGCMITHHNVTRLFDATHDWYQFDKNDVWTLFHSYAFDFSVWEIWGAFIYGGRLVIVPYLISRSPERFYELLGREQVTVLNQTPSAFGQLIQAEEILGVDPDLVLRFIIFGGEALDLHSLKPWFERHGDQKPQLINMYGITETTVHVTYRPITLADLQKAPGSVIGVPIPDLQLYILDQHLQPAPIGVAGELYVGGAGLAKGYLNRPELTQKRFIPNPFNDTSGARLYKTGDLARYLSNRDIEYLGRIDHQVKIRGFRIELGEIEAVLSHHPEIQANTVIVREDMPGDKALVAYVVANQSATPEQNGNTASDQHKADWKKKWDALYQAGAETLQEEGDSFQAIDDNVLLKHLSDRDDYEAEVEEGLAQTFQRINSLNPDKVMEIGCGTGAILTQIAPTCSYYLGTDYAELGLNEVERRLNAQGQNLPHIKLDVRDADDFTGIKPGSFDTVLIISVIQYFPNVHYLHRVIEGAIKATAPGGAIYISDVQSYAMLETHHAFDQLKNAPDDMSTEQLRNIVDNRVRNEDELVVDPGFFYALKAQFPSISRVELKHRRGHIMNETTLFHYDVFLHLEPESATVAEPTWLDWSADNLTINEVKRILKETQPATYCIAGIPNDRNKEEVNTLKMLRDKNGPLTVGELKQALKTIPVAIDPEDMWALSQSLPYEVDIRWCDSNGDGRYEAVFIRRDLAETKAIIVPPREMEAPSTTDWARYANSPMLKSMTNKLAPQLRGFLKESLPDYMVPSSFVILDSLPLTANGKVDRKALPAPEHTRIDQQESYVAPRTSVEERAAHIWMEVLRLDKVGVYDNFFDLGGHSLLAIQVIIRLREEFGVELSLVSLFEVPTIETLAERIEALSYVQDMQTSPTDTDLKEDYEEFEI